MKWRLGMTGVMWNRQRQGFEGRWWCNPSPLLKANSYPLSL